MTGGLSLFQEDLDEALAAEFERGAMSGVNATHKSEVEIRRATVERIRERLNEAALNPGPVARILDEEADR